MKQRHDFDITLIVRDRRWSVRVQRETTHEDGSILYVATASDFINLAESPAGFGDTIQEAIEKLLEVYGKPMKFYTLKSNSLNEGPLVFEEVEYPLKHQSLAY